MKILSRYRVRNALVAGGLAALGALLVIVYVVSYRNSVKQGADLVTVYVAARDIPAGYRRCSRDRRSLSEEARPSSAGTSSTERSPTPPRSPISRRAQTILAGEQITVRQFHSAAQQGVLANISGNLRAITIPGNNYQLLAGIVSDGDHVDVLANVRYSVKGLGQPRRSVASSSGTCSSSAHRAASNGGGGLGGAGAISNSITFAITDSQAEKLFFAVQNTSWSLVLRPVAKPSDSPRASRRSRD